MFIKKNGRKLYNGLTLVELVISISLVAIVMGLIMSLIVNNTKLFAKAELNVRVQNEGRTIENFILNEVKYASEVYIMNFEDLPDGIVDKYYIYLNENDDGIYYVEKGDDFDKNTVGKYGVYMGSLEEMAYELEFSLIEKENTSGSEKEFDKTAFDYRINIMYKDDSFEIESAVNIANTTENGYTNVVVPFKKDLTSGNAISFDFDTKITGLGSYILYDEDNTDKYGNMVGANKKKLESDVMGRFSGNNIDLWIEFDQEYEANVEASGDTSQLFVNLYPTFDFVGEVIDVRWKSGTEYDFTNSAVEPVEYDVKGTDGAIKTYFVRAYRVENYSYEKIQNDCNIVEYSFLKSNNNKLNSDYITEVDEAIVPIGTDGDGNNIYELIIEGAGGVPIKANGELQSTFDLIPYIEFEGVLVKYKQPGDEEFTLYSDGDFIDLMKSSVKDHYPDEPTKYVLQSLDGQVTKIYNVYYRIYETSKQATDGYIEETGPIFYKMVIAQPLDNKIVGLNPDVSLLNTMVYCTDGKGTVARSIQAVHQLPSTGDTFEVMLVMTMVDENTNYRRYNTIEYSPPENFLILQDGTTAGTNTVERIYEATKGLNSAKAVNVNGSSNGTGVLISMSEANSSLGFATTSRIETNVNYPKLNMDVGMIGVLITPLGIPEWNRLALVSAYTIPKHYGWETRFPSMRTAFVPWRETGSMQSWGWEWTPSDFPTSANGSSTSISSTKTSRAVYFSLYCTDNYFIGTYHYTADGDEILDGPQYSLIDSFKLDMPIQSEGHFWQGTGFNLYYIFRGISNVGTTSNAVSFNTISNFFYHTNR